MPGASASSTSLLSHPSGNMALMNPPPPWLKTFERGVESACCGTEFNSKSPAPATFPGQAENVVLVSCHSKGNGKFEAHHPKRVEPPWLSDGALSRRRSADVPPSCLAYGVVVGSFKLSVGCMLASWQNWPLIVLWSQLGSSKRAGT